MFSKQEYLENISFYMSILVKQGAILLEVLEFHNLLPHYNLSISSIVSKLMQMMGLL